jgi:superkiller protein 3
MVGPELRSQAERLLADLAMLAELERIRLDQAAVKDGWSDLAGADAAYAAAFGSYGVDVDALGPAEAGARLRGRAIAVQLAAGLDNWAMARKQRGGKVDLGWRRLLEVAGEVDPEPGQWRATFREAMARHTYGEELERLAGAAPLGELSATTLNLLGDLLSTEGATEAAVSVRRTGLRRYPADFWLNHYLAYDLTELQPPQLDEAIGYYRAALALRPESPGVHLNLSNALRVKGRLDEAIACLEEALRLKPDYAEAHDNLGNLLRAQGRLDEAIAHFREAIRLKPDVGAHNSLGLALQDKGRPDESMACFREALRLKPEDGTAHYNLGRALHIRGRLDEAIASYREAIRLQPDTPNAHIGLGAALFRQDRLDEAIVNLREATRLQPDNAMAHNNLGSALKAQGRLDEAIISFREALGLQPRYINAHRNLGIALQAAGRLDEAIASFREAVDLNPNFGCAYNNLGIALFRKGELDRAVAACKEGVRLGPANHSDHHVALGDSLAATGEPAEAVACYDQALRVKPDDAAAQANLAWLLATCQDPKLRDPARAVELARKAVALSPEAGSTWKSLGVARYRVGEWASAIADLEKSEALEPDTHLAFNGFFLAMSHWRLRRLVEARQWYDKAVARMEKSRPGDEEPRRLRAEAGALMGLAELPADVFARP